jgi:O-antigen ligase
MALALIMSRSRMGNSAFLTSLTLIGLLYVLIARGTFRTRMIVLWISIMVVDISFLGSYFGLDQLKQRLETTTTSEMDNRVDISNHLQPYVLDYQTLGSGLGTFQKAFMPYLGPDMQFIYQGAENDYLQFMGETGVMAALPALLVLGCLIVALRVVRSGNFMLNKGMSFAAVMGVASILIHSLVDFNLQIPANAYLFVVLLAIGWITRYLSPATHRGQRDEVDRLAVKEQ